MYILLLVFLSDIVFVSFVQEIYQRFWTLLMSYLKRSLDMSHNVQQENSLENDE